MGATQVFTESIKADYLYAAIQADRVTKLLASTLHNSPDKPTGQQWRHPLFLRFRQLWPQLTVSDGMFVANINQMQVEKSSQCQYY